MWHFSSVGRAWDFDDGRRADFFLAQVRIRLAVINFGQTSFADISAPRPRILINNTSLERYFPEDYEYYRILTK